ncbi:M28 family peptidase [Granulicella aggregans]|uniref:M28 family peptidase n=1 Tax=Granulicella aggregans TaxID=474949 RepID=UPI0021E00842|nr:M28 family peptidase [Granulicella aggregans]
MTFASLQTLSSFAKRRICFCSLPHETRHLDRSAAKWRDPRISLFRFTSPRLSTLRQLAISLCVLSTLACSAQKHPSPISGQAIYNLTQQYVNTAPHRYVGSPDHAAAEAFIKSQFAPEIAKGTFETDSFVASTPIGMVPMRNYIVRYPGKKDGIIVLASHYETNYPLKDINFVGANDGACTTALLIEIAHYLRTHPPEGYSVWIVFDDGEEAIKEWSDSDSLYGTRHLAAKWSKDSTITKIKAFLLADMIGDKDLNIPREGNSTQWLSDLLATAAKNTGHSANVFKSSTTELDDHLPFKQRNVPVLDIGDFDYGPHTAQMPDGYHHTAQDTMDKISAKSLQTSADLFLEMIHLINERK